MKKKEIVELLKSYSKTLPDGKVVLHSKDFQKIAKQLEWEDGEQYESVGGYRIPVPRQSREAKDVVLMVDGLKFKGKDNGEGEISVKFHKKDRDYFMQAIETTKKSDARYVSESEQGWYSGVAVLMVEFNTRIAMMRYDTVLADVN